jgi:outer membrane protein assembly factor BamE (lipoprotein component of BamABCDE complex)
MKKIILAIVALLVSFLLTVCSSYKGGYAARERSSSWPPRGKTKDSQERPRPSPGQLTSGEWSDIKNYEFYLNLFNITNDPDIEESQRRNSFEEFINYFGFETRYMFTVNVIRGGLPAGDAVVELYDSNQDILFSAKTDVRGSAYLFPSYNLSGENITVKVRSGSYEFTRQFNNAQDNLQITLDNGAAAQSVLDLMFVIDTTGSMGDELRYLKEEISDVISKISSNNPNYTINLALLFYRDTGDEYVTRYFDFTTDIQQQRQNLSRQSANGGGDFPEAVDKALSEAVEKNWSGGYATRLIFHVCDAPPHNTQQNATLYFNSIKTAAQKGIRIIPVASSGIDLATEYLLRQEALMTGGTYIFLTDDSGIGGEHLQPTVGEYTVEYLNACMVRVVNEYLSGVEEKPVSYY